MTQCSIFLCASNLVLMCVMAARVEGYATDSISKRIILREEWNAVEPKAITNLTDRPAPYVVVHHSATKSCFSEASCKKLVLSFQNYHMVTKKWDDIAYNFVIGEDGNAYEGRGWGIKGSHATKYNAYSMGICITGMFTDKMPNDKAMDTLKQLIDYGVKTGEIKEEYQLIGHLQAAATECPGKTLYEAIRKWDHYQPHPIDPRR